MEHFTILTHILLAPLIAVCAIAIYSYVFRAHSEDMAMVVCLVCMFGEVVLGVLLWGSFDQNNSDFQFEEKLVWFRSMNIFYSLGVDSFSIYLVLLTIFLTPVCIAVGLKSIKTHRILFVSLFLILETCVIGVFCAKDLILFYVFFEAFLIPMYLIIGIWGGKNRVYASIKFFIYTLFGSILMLLAIAYIFVHESTNDITELATILQNYPLEIQKLLWLAFFISFAIKIPLWPFHTWLPDAHVEAPTSGSVILAGVLLKIGGYGLLRFNLPMFPEASIYFADYVLWISIIAVIYTSIVALMQTDMKKMIAYSSVAHMGYVVAGIFSFNVYGIQGAIFQMISHGLVSSALFLCVGVLYAQTHTKAIVVYQGLAHKMPKFSLLFTVFVMASIGLPSTAGFVGEFLVLLGAFEFDHLYGILLTFGMVLGAAYMLWLYIRTIFGDHNKTLQALQDIKGLDRVILTVFAILIITIGVYPKIINDYSQKAVEQLVTKISNVKIQKLNR
ncbi:NADH-quinone oxidoreductase subunit M [Candidatus Bandiella euplotis]|uniref:NADH-quinone oxidoreductase subunit M n=1 Tax=Candidatus Bandiella euplotis TaxID=1664265 RepID=A0ABZ0UMI9_9RICK|nr:NADH-quinone oxidoreductase subunit M [Candidatus Bandiella woodruffii]WPX95985.1 NADH-quinone oxidoreductase subunit M [Candidatus Bandiella woodruffii]